MRAISTYLNISPHIPFLNFWTRTQIVGPNFWKSASKIGMLGLKCPTIWLKLKKKIQLWYKKEWIWQSSWRIPSGRIRIYNNRFWFDQKMFVDVGVDFGKKFQTMNDKKKSWNCFFEIFFFYFFFLWVLLFFQYGQEGYVDFTENEAILNGTMWKNDKFTFTKKYFVKSTL